TIFAGAFLVGAFIRGFSPDINGLEKFADFGILNSIIQTQTIPPANIWYAGEPLSYYYFGHFSTAILTTITQIPASISYNLMIATLFALVLSMSAVIGGSLWLWQQPDLKLTRLWRAPSLLGLAAVTAFLVCLRGNLHPAAFYLNTWLQVDWLPSPAEQYQFADATRYIANSIPEFPSYSFVVADLHAHLLNLPSVLLLLAALLTLFKKISASKFVYLALG